MTSIEEALQSGKVGAEEYLSNVSAANFIKDVQELKKAYSNKAAIESAIKHLQSFL